MGHKKEPLPRTLTKKMRDILGFLFPHFLGENHPLALNGESCPENEGS